MKSIIILNRLPGPGIQFRYLLWAAVPAGREPFYADPNKGSAYKDATQVEIDALKAGEVVERVAQVNKPAGTPIAQIQAELEALAMAFQSEINGSNEWQRYGTHFESGSWTLGGA